MNMTQTIRIRNLNYAGVPLFLGLVVAPVLIIALIVVVFHGGMHDDVGQTDWRATILIGGVLFGSAICLVFVALTKAVLWIELGDEIRYRTLLKTAVMPWNSVANLRFEEDQSKIGIGSGMLNVGVGLGRHQILVIQFENGRELRVKVTGEQGEHVLEIAGAQMDAEGGVRSRLPVRWE